MNAAARRYAIASAKTEPPILTTTIGCLNVVKGPLKVREQVAPVLNTDGHAHQSIRHAAPSRFLFRETRMRCCFGMTGQGFHSTERHCISRDPQTAKKVEGTSLTTL